VALFGAKGEDLGALPDQTLAPYGFYQFNQPFAGKATSGRAVVTRVSGGPLFTAYAVLNDAVTSDGSFVPPVLGDDASGADRLVPSGSYGLFYPGLTLAESAEGAAFVYALREDASQRSNLAVVNRGDAGDAITLRVTLFSSSGTALGTLERTLAPGEWYQFG